MFYSKIPLAAQKVNTIDKFSKIFKKILTIVYKLYILILSAIFLLHNNGKGTKIYENYIYGCRQHRVCKKCSG